MDVCWCSVAQLYPTPCDSMNYSPPASSVHRIFQARILEWVAISSFSCVGFDSKQDFAPPAILLALLLCPWMWGIFFGVIQYSLWRRKWQPTPVFLPGESQGRRSLLGCRLWGHTESDTTKAT